MAAPRYLALVSGVLTEVAGAESTTGGEAIISTNSSGVLDISFMPPGIGPETVSVVASANLTAGQFVNIWDNAGTANVRPADGSTTGKPANGFVLSNFSSAATALVYLSGVNNQQSGMTAGDVFLSDSTPGAVTSTAPSTAGHTCQKVGVAIGSTTVGVNLGPPVTLA